MKKISLLIALVAVLSFGAFAADGGKKTNDVDKVYYSVLQHFSTEFTRAEKVTWTVDDHFQKAEFVMNHNIMTAFYDLNGEYLGHTEHVQYQSLPANARKQISSLFEGYFVKNVIWMQRADDASVALTRLYVTGPTYNDTYLVNLTKDGKEVILNITPSAEVEVLSKN